MTVAKGRTTAGMACWVLLWAATGAVWGQNSGFSPGTPPGNPNPGGQQAGQAPPPYGPQPIRPNTPPGNPAAVGPQQGPPQGVPQQRPTPGPPVAAPRVPMAPFQLTPPQEQYLNDILRYWEFKSRGIERFRTKFVRLEYDPVFGPKDPDTPKTESTGVIMYAAPDKGLFKVEKVSHYVAPQGPNDQVRYEERSGEVGEHWVCDGQSVFEYNHQQKKLIQYQLPQEMQGKAIANSPLPFVFGANANQIQQRFWMRVITPREAQGEYWLEAYPKSQADAANYQKIEIILDEKEYLPKAIQVFDPTYDVRRNPKRTTFIFDEREVNWNILAQKLNIFHKEFYEPALPGGWTKEIQSPGQSAAPKAQEARRTPANRAPR
jgi:TIGR03009 family protein